MDHHEQKIKNAVQESLNRINQLVYPIDVLEIAKNYDIQVFGDNDLSEKESGFICVNDKNGYDIVINQDHSVVRKRFTLAHEIAHFLFDKDYLNIHKSIDRNGNPKDASYRYREIRANKFASALLMPEEKFIDIFIKKEKCIDKIADYFLVSKDATRFRAMSLGLITA